MSRFGQLAVLTSGLLVGGGCFPKEPTPPDEIKEGCEALGVNPDVNADLAAGETDATLAAAYGDLAVRLGLTLSSGEHFASGEIADASGETTAPLNCVTDTGDCAVDLYTDCGADARVWDVELRDPVQAATCDWVLPEGMETPATEPNCLTDEDEEGGDVQFISVDGRL